MNGFQNIIFRGFGNTPTCACNFTSMCMLNLFRNNLSIFADFGFFNKLVICILLKPQDVTHTTAWQGCNYQYFLHYSLQCPYFIHSKHNLTNTIRFFSFLHSAIYFHLQHKWVHITCSHAHVHKMLYVITVIITFRIYNTLQDQNTDFDHLHISISIL